MVETGEKIDSSPVAPNAESISAMLMAFPHLFPNSTNLWIQMRRAIQQPTPSPMRLFGKALVLLQRCHGRIQICIRSEPRPDHTGFQEIGQGFCDLTCDGCHYHIHSCTSRTRRLPLRKGARPLRSDGSCGSRILFDLGQEETPT